MSLLENEKKSKLNIIQHFSNEKEYIEVIPKTHNKLEYVNILYCLILHNVQ